MNVEMIAATIGEIFGIILWISIAYCIYRYFKKRKTKKQS